jgi:hypothetical protein
MLSVVMLSVIVIIVIMLSVVVIIVVMLSVTAKKAECRCDNAECRWHNSRYAECHGTL